MITRKVIVLEQWRCVIDLRQINSRAPGNQLSDELSIIAYIAALKRTKIKQKLAQTSSYYVQSMHMPVGGEGGWEG